MEKRFYNPKIELLSPQEIKELQLYKLKKVLQRVYQRVPFYRKKLKEAGIRINKIKSLSELKEIPFTNREDLFIDYPYGLLAEPIEKVVRVHTSSGTTGRPKAIFFSKRDLWSQAELIARALVMTGSTSMDICKFHDLWTFYRCLSYALWG